MLHIIILIICLIVLIIGTYTDLKTREVPDLVNYGLIFTGFAIALIFSVVKSDWLILLGSVFGFLVMFIIACLMFYTGQWGGGDSKMIMGLGALIGIPLMWPIFPLSNLLSSWKADIPFLFSFFVYSFIAGAFYGLIWSVVIALKRKKEFFSELKLRLRNKKMIMYKYAILGLAIICFIIVFLVDNIILKIYFLGLTIVVVIGFYLSIFIRAVEKVCMIKKVDPVKLTEGDWIQDDVVVDGKTIAGKKDLGVSKEQIDELIELNKEKKIDFVVIKEGIPFVPSFLIGFLLAYFVGFGWIVGFFS